MKQKTNILARTKKWILFFVRRSTTLHYKDVNYHTGFYRFSKNINGNHPNFKIDGVPCLPQDGFKEFIFFTETNMVGWYGVIAVEKYYA